ncbi:MULTISPECIES: aspartyl-phosphate phosphatase Spo0E family protein [unclassified Bacillus (in: firmicutes)]|uniref:aspartyl-phosphate phosphatase Spo0E family protein n=1 Tax=unclassified Bacillus (in: firmicutes) TaxID=185979 RepID=UPI00203535DA|nr:MULTISPECIES: aspartyl-phosphate phosphatase Spo0E family protein [unclassified Bacillus (in: firmicutes)]
MKNEAISNKEMTSNIDGLRAQMIEFGMLKGLSHPETIKSSQLLDKWLFKYQKTISTLQVTPN